MLTESDIAWIKANRSEITAQRTESIVLVRFDGTQATVNAVFKMPGNGGEGTAADDLGNVDLHQGDVRISLDSAADVNGAFEVIRGSKRYVLKDVDERGIGTKNRYECTAEEIRIPGQSVIVTKAGASDGWGGTAPGAPVSHAAYVVEETNVVVNQFGEEATCQIRILINGIAAVSYDDKITYTNELGVTVDRVPVKINVKRRVSGRPMLTEVFV